MIKSKQAEFFKTSVREDDTDPRPRPQNATKRALPDHLKQRIATRRALKGGK